MKNIIYLIFLFTFLISTILLSRKINRLRILYIVNRIDHKIRYPKEDNFFSVSFKDIVICPKKSLNIGFFGQSNHGNIIRREKNIDISNKKIYNYDWRLGVCSKYKEPLAGVGGRSAHGHISKDTIYFLQKNYNYLDDLIIFGYSKGNSTANDWANGVPSKKLDIILKNLQKNNMRLDFVFWHQGESEIKNQNKFTLERYEENIQNIFKKFLRNSSETKVGMALVSVCNSNSNKALLTSQKSIIEKSKRIFFTMNTDVLGSNYRYDGCHFNSLAAAKIGKKYADLVNKLK